MIRFWLFLVAVLGASAPACATWYEARSRHFVVYSEGSPASVRKFSSDLERFDQAIRKLLSYSDSDGVDPNPVTVFTLNGISALNNLCRGGKADNGKACRYIAGWYSARVSGSVAFVPRKAGTGPYGLDAQTILFHEYTHHLMLANSGAAYPAWYVEGFAEFFSNAKLDKPGEVGLGLPANSRAPALALLGGMPIRKLLTASPSQLSGDESALFYAKSWLLTHYLNFSGERNDQLLKYLQSINRGMSSEDAATAAFGDLDKLGQELQSYMMRQRIRYISMLIPALPDEAIAVRSLSAGEVAMMPVRIQSDRGVNKETANGVAVQARAAAAPYPDDPAVQVALAEAEYDVGNLDAAEAAVDRALAKDPDHAPSMVYKAQVLMRRAHDAGKRDADTWRDVRRWLLKANGVEADAAEPLYLYYLTYRMQNIKPTDNALAALERAFVLVPQDNSVRMNLVGHYMIENRLAEARVILAPLAFNPHLSPDSPAIKMLAQINERLKTGKGKVDMVQEPTDPD